jgi:hypothetical protein
MADHLQVENEERLMLEPCHVYNNTLNTINNLNYFVEGKLQGNFVLCFFTVKEFFFNLFTLKHNIKLSLYRPGEALRAPGVEASRFIDNRHMKVARLSALRTGCLYPQGIPLLLFSVRN